VEGFANTDNFMNTEASNKLKRIPSVEKVKQLPQVVELLQDLSDEFLTVIVRDVLAEIREGQKKGGMQIEMPSLQQIEEAVLVRVRDRLAPPLQRVINGTGIVIHTNLGRSIMGKKVIAAIGEATGSYCDLEYDLEEGERGHRDAKIEHLLCSLTGAEAATVVNNNAAAVMLSLDTLAKGREVIVSRGELIEIGGSFRIPDVMAKSGAKMVEVGTTNRTYISDYERALSPETSLLLKVHPSNYRIVGFTQQVALAELVELGRKRGIPVMEDLGSGALVNLRKFGIDEPTVQQSVKESADIITFSGDKLLGGPQAGIILGKKEYIKDIRKNPLMRAFRVDKLTLSALGALIQTLLSSRAPEKEIPTLEMISRSPEQIHDFAMQVYESVDEQVREHLHMEIVEGESEVGGGSCPTQSLPTYLLGIKPDYLSPGAIHFKLRMGTPPIIGIIRNDIFCLDFRTIQAEEVAEIGAALTNLTALD
jgi:L-seryl-tRNA(Ser) seleniumtransferase